MDQSTRALRHAFLRDAAVSTLVLAGLYALAQGVRFQPLQIPGYLLVVGFDVLEAVFGGAGTAYYPLFAAYVLGLGVLGAAVATAVRSQSRERDLAVWRVGTAGALGVVGLISLLYGGLILVSTPQRTPVLVTGAAGLTMLALAAWLAGLVGPASPRRQ